MLTQIRLYHLHNPGDFFFFFICGLMKAHIFGNFMLKSEKCPLSKSQSLPNSQVPHIFNWYFNETDINKIFIFCILQLSDFFQKLLQYSKKKNAPCCLEVFLMLLVFWTPKLSQ